MAKAKDGSVLSVQKQSVLLFGGVFLEQKPHLDTRTENHQGDRKSAGGSSTISITLRRRGAIGDSVSAVLWPTSSTSSISSVV